MFETEFKELESRELDLNVCETFGNDEVPVYELVHSKSRAEEPQLMKPLLQPLFSPT